MCIRDRRYFGEVFDVEVCYPIEHSFPVLGVNVLHSVCLTPFAKTVAVYKFHQVRVCLLYTSSECYPCGYLQPDGYHDLSVIEVSGLAEEPYHRYGLSLIHI